MTRVVDGSRGEGGGQVARIALALAAATGTPVRVVNVRAGRPEPGLKPQHVAAALALAELSGGEADGVAVGSAEVTLRPGPVSGGAFTFRVGTAGAVTLVLQALLPALVASRQQFDIALEGGTNVRWSPQWDDFVHVHVPLLRRIGIEVEPTLGRRGYFPQGGGEVRVTVETPAFHRVGLTDPGPVSRFVAVLSSHGLPRHIMERAHIALVETLRDVAPVIVETDFHRGPGTGMAVAVRAECARSVLGGDAVGRKGVRVEDVVQEAVGPLLDDVRAGAGVDVHQADQLPVFMALAGGGEFTTRRLSAHARTVLDMLPEFLPVRCDAEKEDGLVRVRIGRA